jgi:hypothetical protein
MTDAPILARFGNASNERRSHSPTAFVSKRLVLGREVLGEGLATSCVDRVATLREFPQNSEWRGAQGSSDPPR